MREGGRDRLTQTDRLDTGGHTEGRTDRQTDRRRHSNKQTGLGDLA